MLYNINNWLNQSKQCYVYIFVHLHVQIDTEYCLIKLIIKLVLKEINKNAQYRYIGI